MSDCYRILLVEDDKEQYLLVRTMLRRLEECYELEWVDSYNEALAQIQQNSFDVYLIDYGLGAKTGIDLIREPAVQNSDVPAILITNLSDGRIDVDALQAGAADYISKDQMNERLLGRTLRYAMERAQTLRELRQSEVRYRAIVEEQTEFLIRFLPDGTLTFVNESYCRYRHQPREKLIGTQFIDTVFERDRRQLKVAIESLDAVTPTSSNEVRARAHDGSERWHHWLTRAIFDNKGRLFEYQSVIRDITERKRVERLLNERLEQLRTLRRVDAELTETLKIESVIDLAIDSAMRLSGAAMAALALYDEDELVEWRAIGVPEPGKMERIFQERQGVIGRVIATKEAEHIPDMSNDPDCIPTLPNMVSLMVIPMLSQERFVGVISLETHLPERFNREVFDFIQLLTARIAVSIDNARLIDLLKQQLDELKALYEQVTELEQLKTDMIRIASHDLRNPLGVVQGYSEMMRQDVKAGRYDAQRFTENLDSIEKAIRRMQKITTDILSLERIERTNSISQDPVDLSMVVRDVAYDHQYLAITRNQTFNIDVPDMPTMIQGDYAQLREAAANLIGNAIKYTPEGGRIDVIMEFDGDAVIFEVTDTGYGIPYEMQQRLFQPFYRAKTKETSNIEGTGLGLHLVKNIVERHNGRMIFRSRYQEGSTFGFQLPAIPRE